MSILSNPIVLAALVVVLLMGILAAILFWNKPAMLIGFQILFCCVMGILSSQLRLPGAIKYFTDIICMALFGQLIISYKQIKKTLANIKGPLLCIIIYHIFTTLGLFITGQPLISFFWGMHVMARFFVFFVACACFLRLRDVEIIMKMLFALLPINVLVCSFQFFVQGYKYDYNGGLFGTEVGCNGNMNIYLCLLAVFTVLFLFEKKMKPWQALAVFVMIIYIAALSELKIIFFEVPLLIAVYALFSRNRKKVMGALVIILIGVYIGIQFFVILYPTWAGFFSPATILRYLRDESYGGDGTQTLNRLSVIPYVYNILLPDLRSKLFGMGIGNTDWSSIFVSESYYRYGYLRYGFFGFATVLFESGLLGIGSYIAFFVTVVVSAVKKMGKNLANSRFYMSGVLGVALFAVYGIYNQTNRLEISYLVFWGLAVPFIAYRSHKENEG